MNYYLVTFSEIFYPYISFLAQSEKAWAEYKPIPLSTKGVIAKEDIELLLIKMLGHREDLEEIKSIETNELEAVNWSKSVDFTTYLNIDLFDKEGYKSRIVFKCGVLQVAEFEENLVPEALLTHEKALIRNFIKKFRKRYKGY